MNMSDGTLRPLGILVALFQVGRHGEDAGDGLVGIEEPELALHPAAAGVLRDALQEAAVRRQVLVTSHSPELLDDPHLAVDSLLAVTAASGTTRIGKVDEAARFTMQEKLYTAGELLRLDQLAPDPAVSTPLPLS